MKNKENINKNKDERTINIDINTNITNIND